MQIEKMLKNEAKELREFISNINEFNFKEKFEKYLNEASDSAEGLEKEFVSALVNDLNGNIADLLADELLKLDKDKLKRAISEFYYDGSWALTERDEFDDIFTSISHISDESFYHYMKPIMEKTLEDIIITKDRNSITAKIVENEKLLKQYSDSIDGSKKHIATYEERIKEIQETLNKLKGAN